MKATLILFTIASAILGGTMTAQAQHIGYRVDLSVDRTVIQSNEADQDLTITFALFADNLPDGDVEVEFSYPTNRAQATGITASRGTVLLGEPAGTIKLKTSIGEGRPVIGTIHFNTIMPFDKYVLFTVKAVLRGSVETVGDESEVIKLEHVGKYITRLPHIGG